MFRVTSRGAAYAAALLIAGCSQGPGTPSSVTSPTAATAAGTVSASATGASGDVIVGNGPLEFVRLRMDRQNSLGASVLRQYALPGQTYQMEAGETIELWAEWVSPTNPRLIINWGEGDTDFVNCGSCLMKHTYRRPGVYVVSAKLDDRVSTTITRTFTLNVADPSPANTRQFCTSGAISIPDEGEADPYPSELSVSGMTGAITSVTATLRGMHHTYDYDLYVGLEAPNKAADAALMYEYGDGYEINTSNITFADGGAAWPMTSDIGPGDLTFAAADPLNSRFAGLAANGNWLLYIEDLEGGDEGGVDNGWCVTITTDPNQTPVQNNDLRSSSRSMRAPAVAPRKAKRR